MSRTWLFTEDCSGKVWALHKGSKILVGRRPDCDVVAPAGTVSGKHCLVSSKPTSSSQGSAAVEVADLDSANGTFVNGSKLDRGASRVLQTGDAVSLATTDGPKYSLMTPAVRAVATASPPREPEEVPTQVAAIGPDAPVATGPVAREVAQAAQVAPAPAFKLMQPETGRWWHLTAGQSLSVGRHPACDIVMPLAAVSGKHCTITATASDEAALENLSGANGTFVNGKKLARGARQQLQPGDTITLALMGGPTFVVERAQRPVSKHPVAALLPHNHQASEQQGPPTPATVNQSVVQYGPPAPDVLSEAREASSVQQGPLNATRPEPTAMEGHAPAQAQFRKAKPEQSIEAAVGASVAAATMADLSKCFGVPTTDGDATPRATQVRETPLRQAAPLSPLPSKSLKRQASTPRIEEQETVATSTVESGCWCLIDDATGDAFALHVGTDLTIGHAGGCSIIVDQPGIRGVHCALAVKDGKRRRLHKKTSASEAPAFSEPCPHSSGVIVELLDLGGARGTLLNGHRVPAGSAQMLKPGDAITLAGADGPRFLVEAPGPSLQEQAAAIDAPAQPEEPLVDVPTEDEGNAPAPDTPLAEQPPAPATPLLERVPVAPATPLVEPPAPATPLVETPAPATPLAEDAKEVDQLATPSVPVHSIAVAVASAAQEATTPCLVDLASGAIHHLPERGIATAGSLSDCEVVVAAATVSGRHCALLCSGGGLVELEDLSATHGTYLNGVRLPLGTFVPQRVPLRHGDVVSFAATGGPALIYIAPASFRR